MPALIPILKSPITWIAAAVLATLAVLGVVYGKGEKAGASNVTTKVQETTIKTLDAARTDKEKANEKVRNTPLDAVIDGLR